MKIQCSQSEKDIFIAGISKDLSCSRCPIQTKCERPTECKGQLESKIEWVIVCA